MTWHRRLWDLLTLADIPRPAPARTVVACDAEAVTVTRPGGPVERVRWADLAAVVIRTTSGGPFVDDVFWLLVGDGARSGCVVPSEADGCDRLRDRLHDLPGFDHAAVIRAMQCTDDRDFLCWERRPGG